jgi:hypothetical protein
MMKNLLCIALLLGTWPAWAQFSDDFETGRLSGWLQIPANTWSASSATNRLNGNFSLRHSASVPASGSYTDYISAPTGEFALHSGTTIWRFRMRYHYNPTANNKWAIMLAADADATAWESGTYRGFAIGVNQAAGVTDKRLCLYFVENKVYSELLKTDINWNDSIGTSAATTVCIEIQRDAEGKWAFYLAKSSSFSDLRFYGTVSFPQDLTVRFFGAVNRYSSSSAGAQKLWIDDIRILSTALPAQIASVTQQGLCDLWVDFTKPLLVAEAENTAHYFLSRNEETVHPQQVVVVSPTRLKLSFARLLRGDVSLHVQNLPDENHRDINDRSDLRILYFLYGDVVINEIMADPEPSAGLPEAPYIELYCRAEVDLPLAGWTLAYNTTSGNIGAATIPAGGYLILCAASQADVLKEYGAVTSLTNMASLTKSGKTLCLKTAEGQLIARVAYSDRWITDTEKREGGWSLEKIDPDNLSETGLNWTVSESPDGGTPGRRNAAAAHNPDREPPYIVALQMLDPQTLQLTFNELFDADMALLKACYRLNSGAEDLLQIVLNPENPTQLALHFASPLTMGQVYELTVAAPFCDLAGNAATAEPCRFGYFFPPEARDIVINEVLFHPYPGGADFVELYNRSDKIIDLRHVVLAHRNEAHKIASLRSITQPHFLYPDDYVVLTTDPEALRRFYAVPFPEKVLPMPSLPSYPNESGCVVLLSDEEALLDEWTYSETMHNAFVTNPSGIALERVNPHRPSQERANWQSAAQSAGFATPTGRNSQYNPDEAHAPDEFSLPHEVFSPDGDGYNDVLFIDYQMTTPGCMANITIYDPQGRMVKELEKNSPLGASGRFAWDGSRHDLQKAPPGTYILFIEYFNAHGFVKHLKKPCALALRR